MKKGAKTGSEAFTNDKRKDNNKMLITIIISLFIIAITFFKIFTKEDGKVFRILCSIFFGCFVFLILTGLSYLFSSDDYYDYEKTTTGVETISSNELLNFQDVKQNESEYSYVIAYASGSSKDIMYYSYYVKTDYGYEYQKISPEEENVYIRYCNENETPRIETEVDKYEVKKILIKEPNIWTSNIVSFLKYHKYSKGDVITTEEWTANEWHKRTIFYIPKDSISVQYDVDMQ